MVRAGSIAEAVIKTGKQIRRFARQSADAKQTIRCGVPGWWAVQRPTQASHQPGAGPACSSHRCRLGQCGKVCGQYVGNRQNHQRSQNWTRFLPRKPAKVESTNKTAEALLWGWLHWHRAAAAAREPVQSKRRRRCRRFGICHQAGEKAIPHRRRLRWTG